MYETTPLAPRSASLIPRPEQSSAQLSQKLGTTQILPKAKEFEAILLSQWLQGAESSFGSVPGSSEGEDAGDEQFKGFAVQQLAKNIVNAGGIGIAAIVAKALTSATSGSDQSTHAPTSHVGVTEAP